MSGTRRNALGLLVIAAVALVVATGAEPNAGSGSKSRAVSGSLTYLQSVAAQPASVLLIQNFQRVFPGVQISATYPPANQITPLLATQIAAGNAPDVFRATPGGSDVNGVWLLAGSGKLLDLSKEPWVKRIYGPARPFMTFQRKVYAWPLTVFPIGVAYNTELFSQLGLTVPKTMTQVLAMCRKVRAAGKVPFAGGFSNIGGTITWAIGRMVEYVYSADPTWTAKRSAGKVTFAGSPLWRRALQSIVDMKDAGCFQDHPEGASVPAQYQMFASGNAVMTHVGSPETASILAINPNLKFGFFNLPGDTANNAVLPINTSLTVAISASTKNPEAAKALVAFLARAKQSTLFAKVNGGIAPFDATKGVLPAPLSGVAPFFKSGKAMMAPNNAWPNPTLLLSTLAPDIVGLFTGQKTVDSTLADLDAAW